jgi:hypothetical protein
MESPPKKLNLRRFSVRDSSHTFFRIGNTRSQDRKTQKKAEDVSATKSKDLEFSEQQSPVLETTVSSLFSEASGFKEFQLFFTVIIITKLFLLRRPISKLYSNLRCRNLVLSTDKMSRPRCTVSFRTLECRAPSKNASDSRLDPKNL